jgi:hypothetical protein
MAKKSYKQIRLKVPADVHSKLKLKALVQGKYFADWLNDLLKIAAER